MKSPTTHTKRTVKAVPRRSVCCRAEIINWFGNVTNVLLGGKMPGPTIHCLKCGKPCDTFTPPKTKKMK